MRGLQVVLLSLALIGVSGCSSFNRASNQTKRWVAAGSALLVGSIAGSATAPPGERKDMHAVYWGASAGLLSYLAADLYFDDETEAEKLKLQLEVMQSANSVLLNEGKGYFKTGPADESLSNGKGKWRLYKVDRWVKDGPGRLFHQDRMVEILPLNGQQPGQQGSSPTEKAESASP